jgi:hypothetical protein
MNRAPTRSISFCAFCVLCRHLSGSNSSSVNDFNGLNDWTEFFRYRAGGT